MVERSKMMQFGAELDALGERARAAVGTEDLERVRRLELISRSCMVAGRALIHLSFEPLAWSSGVLLLWIHKQLQATEIGHTVLHGAYDALPGAEAWRSKSFWWPVPIDEEAWRYGHNVRHHGATNVLGKDGDVHFGPVRLTREVPYQPIHRIQLPLALLVIFPFFGFLMNLHFTGLLDAYSRQERLDFLPDRSASSKRRAWRQALRKYVPYYAVEFGLFPALAGPFFWKVLLANWLTEVMRDVYSAATIFCGHVGQSTASYPEGTRTGSRGEWYAMQVEASNDFQVPYALSVLCGGLDLQIEHHLFPKLPPERLRQIAPEVREICERHGVRYRKASWPRTLRSALEWIQTLSRAQPSTSSLVRSALAEAA
jgi:NADPH-dependent stearoyl-CoA 9-desaturase